MSDEVYATMNSQTVNGSVAGSCTQSTVQLWPLQSSSFIHQPLIVIDPDSPMPSSEKIEELFFQLQVHT